MIHVPFYTFWNALWKLQLVLSYFLLCKQY
jgi:hypothetical protein